MYHDFSNQNHKTLKEIFRRLWCHSNHYNSIEKCVENTYIGSSKRGNQMTVNPHLHQTLDCMCALGLTVFSHLSFVEDLLVVSSLT